MKRNLFLLAILLSFFGKVFSQPCPATLSPSLYWTQTNVIFDTVGIWNTYPGIPLGSYTGEEKVMSFYSSCEAVLQIITENNLPASGGYRVLYKQHQATCSTQNFVPAPYGYSYLNRQDYLIPLDSGVYYDFVFDYQPYNGTPKIKGNVNIGLYHSSIDSINFFNIYPDSVSIAWSSMYQNVEVKYGPVGSPLVTTIAHNNQATLTGLTPDTKYNFYVKQTCDSYSSYQNFTLKTPPVCATTPMISCDNAAFYPTLQVEPGCFSLSGCGSGSCIMNQSQIINRFIPDTSGIFGINHVTTTGTGIRKMGIFYKDATMGCNEKNWNFIQCGTDQFTWGGNMGPLIAGHTYYVLLSTSTCLGVGGFANNGFKLTCPSPQCSSPATGLSCNAPGNTVCSGKPVSLFPNGSVIGSTGLCNWYQDSCSGIPISHSKNITISPTVSKTYFLQISDSCNTFSCDSITILVNQNPTCSITGSGTICSGSPTQWCAPAGLNSYLWSTGSTTQCITVGTGGTYTVTVTNGTGCSASSSKTLTVNTVTATISGSGIICPGNSTQWCATSGLPSYLWSTGSTSQCITLSVEGTYTLTVTGTNGCTQSYTGLLSIPVPNCSITGSAAICSGTSAAWFAPANHSNSFLWSNGVTNSGTYVNTSGTYTVTVTNPQGCSSSCSKSLTVNSNPSCSVSGIGAICAGSSEQWCATAGFTSYLWTGGATTQCRTISSSGNYIVTVTDANGCTSTCTKAMAFTNPGCSIGGSGIYACSGNSVQWCASAGLASYLWSTGATTRCVSLNTAGIYTVTVADASGCSSTCSATVFSGQTPSCSITGNGSICPGSSAQWCAPSGMSNYFWNTGATTQCISLNTAGTYTVTVNSNGCLNNCSKTLSIAPPTCLITGSGTTCSGSSTQWCAPAGLGYYLWSTGSTTECTTLSSAGIYTVTVTDVSGCSSTCSKTLIIAPPTCSITGSGAICSGSSTQWCAPAGLSSYLWNTGATTQCIALNTAGTYTVTVTDAGGCSSTCSKILTVSSTPSCLITGTGTICPGSSIQWCAPSGLTSYLWSTGSTAQCITVSSGGNYTITVTNAAGCSSTCSKTLAVNTPQTCSITGTGTICSGTSTQWCAPAGVTSYLWSTGATTQCITVSSGGDYTVTVTNATGCSSTCSKTLLINNSPSAFSIIGNATTCTGSTIQWCAPPGYNSYSWSTGATTRCINVLSAGNYTVTIGFTNGCSTSSSKTLVVVTNPVCSITGNGTICSGSSTQWCAPAGLATYAWSTGSTAQCITLTGAGTYTVTVISPAGCTSTCTNTLTVNTSPPVCSITGSGTICSGNSTQWCAPAGLISYLWNNGTTSQCSTLNASGTYTVTVTNSGGCSSSCTKQLTVGSKPAKPGTITTSGGNTKVCTGDSKTYSINIVSGATSYIWTPPAGAVVTSGQGTISATINYTSGFVTDSLKVAAVNSCGTGPYRALKITKGTIPTKPGIILGAVSGVCNTNGVPYLTNNVAGVTYNWTNSNTNFAVATGQGTSSITANINSGYVTGTLTVTPVNGCGTGPVRTLTVKGPPATPPAVGGATSVCANQFGVAYAITPLAGATNYTWAGPTGSHINDGSVTSGGATLVTTATSVTVNYGATAGNLKVRGNNSCGSGSYKTIAVTFNCREEGAMSTFDVNLFPNPADDELTVSFNSPEQSSYSVKVKDIIGNTLLVKTGVSEKGENNFKLSLEDITPGVYLVEIKNGDMSRVMKLVVN